ncbi:MAG: hypothetical protein N2050_03030 [Flavobacteriales bacterium]|nr:hypothetical protein [Flavobacteriales bacterium]
MIFFSNFGILSSEIKERLRAPFLLDVSFGPTYGAGRCGARQGRGPTWVWRRDHFPYASAAYGALARVGDSSWPGLMRTSAPKLILEVKAQSKQF